MAPWWSRFLSRPQPPPPPPPPPLNRDALVIAGVALAIVALAIVFLRRAAHRNRCHILQPGVSPSLLASTECLKDGFASRKLPADGIDVLVIGSGISGLLTAALLSKLGYKCVVVEQHDQAGGSTHTFEEAGFEFDTGLHYVGDVLGILLNAGTSGAPIEWACTGHVVDEVVCGSERVPIRHPKARFLEELHEHFPKERRAINAYARKLDSAKLALGSRLVLKLVPLWLVQILLPLCRTLLPLTTTHDTLAALTSNQKLINLLSYVWGTFGLPPSRSPFAMTAIIQTHYFNGGFYPVGGCSQLAAKLVPTITNAGGKVLVRAPVEQLLFDKQGGRCIGALIKGHSVHAKRVVSAAGMLNTLKLLPEPERARVVGEGKGGGGSPLLRDGPPLRCDNAGGDDGTIEPSNAFAYLFVGLESGGSDALATTLPKHNMWVLPSWEHERDSALPRSIPDADAHPMLLFISSPSAKDPSWSARYPGKHTLVALAPTRFEYWSERGGARLHHRGATYDAFKARMQERMLEEVLVQLPDIRPHVKHVTLGSPLSNNFFLGTSWGEAYGLEHSARRFEATYLRPTTAIPGLYLTGQDTFTDGVAGGALSALVTASVVDPRVALSNAGSLVALGAAG